MRKIILEVNVMSDGDIYAVITENTKTTDLCPKGQIGTVIELLKLILHHFNIKAEIEWNNYDS